MKDREMRFCPRCRKEYDDYPAISRRDNKTEICPICVMNEALEDFLWQQNVKERRS